MAFEMQVFPAGDSGNAPSGTVITGGLFRCVIKGYNAATFSMQGGFQYDSTSYMDGIYPVSYTHLTLPTKRIV